MFIQIVEVLGPGDIKTHNEMLKDRESSSTPQYSESLSRNDAGHQRRGSTQQSLQLVQHPRVHEKYSCDLTSETTSDDHYDTPLDQTIQTPQTPQTPDTVRRTYTQEIAVLDLKSNKPRTGSQDQCRVPKALATPPSLFDNSPSPPKRAYHSLSDLNSQITSSSPLALGPGGTSPPDETPSKRRRLVKQASVRDLLSSIPQLVPLPPSLISPLRSTR